MPSYSDLGREEVEQQWVHFDEKEVARYQALIGSDGEALRRVPVLYCARLWPEFDLFRAINGQELKLRETDVQQYRSLETKRCYLAELRVLNVRQIRHFKKYQLQLVLYEEGRLAVKIQQTFVKEVNG
ncbi:VraC protein [Staphylococcus argensis]|uniref:VraC protein n=1 Tax=Staphylococcus argensis TaxID=1607738 RepID=A0A2K4FD28_9STAP|nr:VraC protein [Staphylococcus argensis]MCY6990884.1 VraC protein [Staphylococcus argensis]POA09264.1 VraC protein [Staphylococcus argensis]